MFNADKNNSFFIGTAGDKEFGRGDTITFLHLSEYAFYEDPENILSSVLQAVTPNGLAFIETTANGFNFFKKFWEDSKRDGTGFKTHFYDPTWEYDGLFLDHKRMELKEKFKQEYPMSEIEAFITSGKCYFNIESLQWYLENLKEPITGRDTIYV